MLWRLMEACGSALWLAVMLLRLIKMSAVGRWAATAFYNLRPLAPVALLGVFVGGIGQRGESPAPDVDLGFVVGMLIWWFFIRSDEDDDDRWRRRRRRAVAKIRATVSGRLVTEPA
jgi:hypothetical protein